VFLLKLKFVLLYFVFIIPVASFAGDFDGSKPLSGTVEKMLEITQFKINDDVDPDTVSLPQKFVINFDKKSRF